MIRKTNPINVSSPLTVDQMLKLDNVLKKRPLPEALRMLKSSNSFTIPNAASKFDLEKSIHTLHLRNGNKAWHIDGQYEVIRGLPIQEFISQKSSKGTEVQSPTLPLPPPEPPEWSDLIYHPKMLPRGIRPRMRRKSGKMLHPHGYIWGSDVRQPYFPSGYPWQCIGRLEVYDNPYSFVPSMVGTGALVGPNTVLTASHVVPWNANPAMIQFIPAYFDGVSTLGYNVSSYISAASSYDQGSPPAPAFDFAVLQLQDRLGDSLGWFGTRSYYDGWNDQNFWTLAGYGSPVVGVGAGAVVTAERPSWQSGISFHDDDEDSNDFGNAMELETQNGDSTPGDSGGPYFAFWDDGPYIVGVDVGGEAEFIFNPFAPWPFEDDNNVASAGPALVQLVEWARENWG